MPHKTFYPPTPLKPGTYEDVRFPSKSGPLLHGLYLKSSVPKRGTIVHCHGNTGVTLDHAPLVKFLTGYGYDTFVFDYGGYGESPGRPSPESIIEDTRAAINYCRQRKGVDPQKIGLFGQSLGGVAAAGAMALEPDIKCLILEGTFTTYRAMAWSTLLGRSLFPITPFVIPNTGPARDLEQIGNRPVLLIHGEKDDTVSVKFSRELHKLFPENTSLLILKNLAHLEGEEFEPDYRREIKVFLDRHL